MAIRELSIPIKNKISQVSIPFPSINNTYFYTYTNILIGFN